MTASRRLALVAIMAAVALGLASCGPAAVGTSSPTSHDPMAAARSAMLFAMARHIGALAGLDVRSASAAPSLSASRAVEIAMRHVHASSWSSVEAVGVSLSGKRTAWAVLFLGVPVHSHFGTARSGIGDQCWFIDATTGAVVTDGTVPRSAISTRGAIGP